METIDKVNGIQDRAFRTAWTTATRLNVFGVGVTVMLSSLQTNGAYATSYVECPPGLGSHAHIHRHDDESFTVLDGLFEFWCGDRQLQLGPGDCVFLPRNVPHSFTCVGEATGHMICINAPAGHEGFFEAASKLSERDTPPTLEEVIAVCNRFGIDILPPPTA